MKTTKKLTEMEDVKINVKMKLLALWAAMMLLYIYADILSIDVIGNKPKLFYWTQMNADLR